MTKKLNDTEIYVLNTFHAIEEHAIIPGRERRVVELIKVLNLQYHQLALDIQYNWCKPYRSILKIYGTLRRICEHIDNENSNFSLLVRYEAFNLMQSVSCDIRTTGDLYKNK